MATIPTILAVLTAGLSFMLSIRLRAPSQVLVTAFVMSISAISVWSIYSMIDRRAWPSVLPHIAIFGTLLIVIFQIYLYAKKKRK